MNDNELIMLALLSSLDTETIVDKILSCLMDEGQAAAKYGVSTATIRAWYKMQKIKGFEVGNSLLFLKGTPDPRSNQ